MSRIYDYNQFSSKKNRIGGDFTFGQELLYTDIDLFNRPEEWSDLDDKKAFVEYSVDVEVRKSGIEGLQFRINLIELEFSVDDDPNPHKEFDFDLVPGKNVDFSQLEADPKDFVIPTYPSNLEIDMNKSTEPVKWKIKVSFGHD
jgi:hypothetical protein